MTERFARSLLYYIRTRERRALNWLRAALRKRPGGWLSRIMHADLLVFKRKTVCTGLAIGMFWGFLPMPLQMVPAAFCCWLGRANLPVAIVCVWISNPLTYVPIFYMEYLVGSWLFGGGPVLEQGSFEGVFDSGLTEGLVGGMAPEFAVYFVQMLKGSLVVSVFMAVVGYGMGILIFRGARARAERRRQRNANSH